MRRPVIFIALAGLAAMIASVIVYSALKRRDAEVLQAKAQTTYIVVAAGDLPLGTKIDPAQVKLARWSSDAMPAGAFTNPSQITGAFVKSQFVANEPITASKLFLGQKTAGVMPLLIPPGMRAVSVPVDEVSDIAGFVMPHTHVDVLVAVQGAGSPGEKPFSKIVLQNVEVLAVAQEVEKRKDEPELVKVVTLLVSPQEAERLALATREGVLRLAMRNYTDSKIVLTSGTDVSQMLHAYSSTPAPVMTAQVHAAAAPAHPVKKFQVEIFRNGKTSESVSFVQALAEPPAQRESAAKEKSASASPAIKKKAVQVASDDADDGADDDNAPSRPSTAAAAPVHPAAAPAGSSASLAPAPKIIDIP